MGIHYQEKLLIEFFRKFLDGVGPLGTVLDGAYTLIREIRENNISCHDVISPGRSRLVDWWQATLPRMVPPRQYILMRKGPNRGEVRGRGHDAHGRQPPGRCR